MKGKRPPVMMRMRGSHGYTLIELMIVVAIAAILAIGVVFMFANPSAKVKNQAFTLLGELNRARAQAVSENTNAYVKFNPGAAADDPDGFMTWIDGDGVPDVTYDVGTDTLIEFVEFPEAVQFYDENATDSAGNVPNLKPGTAVALNVEDGVNGDDDGVVFNGALAEDSNDIFIFTPMGTVLDSAGNALGSSGYIYIYVPKSATEHGIARGTPYAVEVTQSTGNIRIWRWTENAWRRK